MKTLFILNDPPYGSERCYNALRLAGALLKNDREAEVSVFLMAATPWSRRRRARRLPRATTASSAC
jgi:sulfur relay (sulfurtransferase) complex TusBCD TusD component (DsrE family)